MVTALQTHDEEQTVGVIHGSTQRVRLPNAGLALVALVLLAGGCASAGQSSGSGPLNQDEIQASSATNAYEAVEQLRPSWLRPRNAGSRSAAEQSVGVVIDERPGASFDDLRSLGVALVERITFLDARTANREYGTAYGAAFRGGAIIVTRAQR